MAAADDIHREAPGEPPTLVRAAQYVRMSTDHQRYSTENQAEAIQEYAAAHGMEIVRTYADEGKSGLNIGGRGGLKQLINDAEERHTDFDVLLVYDVSRWGRFQDSDEAAYYEYVCRRAGLQVVYCAEPFDNDGTPIATIFKGVKRAMASEYSRELSTKVFIGQCRLVELGYRQGGAPGYGLRRLLIDEKGEPKGQLGRGEQKSLQTDRVVLVPGPPEEVDTVRQMYRLFVERGQTESEIAALLKEDGCRTDLGREWTRGTVHQVLTSEKYVGNNVYNHVSFKLKKKRVRNTPDMWIRSNGAFDAVVDQEIFARAQTVIAQRSTRMDNGEMLAVLRQLLVKAGALSGLIIDEQEGMPSSTAYRSRFGSLLRAYSLVGYRPDRDFRYIQINQRLRDLFPQVVADVIAGIEAAGGTTAPPDSSGLLVVNGELRLSIVIARCRETPGGAYRWRLHFDTGLAPDITIAVRMDGANRRALDYYLFPSIDLVGGRLRLTEENGLTIDAYRFDDMGELFDLAARISLAVIIARSDDGGIQQALADAYADGKIRGKNIEVVRRLLERRHRHSGVRTNRFGRTTSGRRPTAEQLVQVFRKEADRQRLIAKKADFVQSRLLFVVQALKELRHDRAFSTLLRAEQLDTMPRALDARLAGGQL